MRWSQLKVQLENRFCEKAKRRVEIFQTRYRHVHRQEGEAWITLDGQRILSRGSESYLKEQGRLVQSHRARGASWAEAYTNAWPVLAASDHILLEQLNRDLFASLSLPLVDIVSHKNPVVRTLGVLDHRLGARSLRKLDTSREHPLVQTLYNFRCELAV